MKKLIILIIMLFFIPIVYAGVACTPFNCTPDKTCTGTNVSWGKFGGDQAEASCGDFTSGITLASDASPIQDQNANFIHVQAPLVGDNSYIYSDNDVFGFDTCISFVVYFIDPTDGPLNTFLGADGTPTSLNDNNGIGAISINTLNNNRFMIYDDPNDWTHTTTHSEYDTGPTEITICHDKTTALGSQLIINGTSYLLPNTAIGTLPDPIAIQHQAGGGSAGEDFNLTFISVYSMSLGYPQTVPDTTPPELSNPDEVWCQSCNPYQQIIDNPWITDDTTPTSNFTMNEKSTCATMGNESGLNNYNYTDMIANGGVECSSTGATVQTCSIQVSNAFTVGENKQICGGCKDAGGHEKTNATWCVDTSIYTFTPSAGETCESDCIIATAGCGLYLEGGCTVIR